MSEKNAEGENFSHHIKTIIEKILSLDAETKAIIQREMQSITDTLKNIQRIRQNISHRVIYHNTGENLSINV
jgi:hypothetical protein